MVMSERHPVASGSQLRPDERRQIQGLALVDGASMSEMARQTGRDRGTVAAVRRSDDSQAFRHQLETEAREAALQILRGTSERAARAWGMAIRC